MIATHTAARTSIGLGTFISVQARAASLATAQRAISLAFEAVACVDRLMHPNRTGSDLRAIRDASVGTAIELHPWTLQVLTLSRRIHDASDGRFDPCLPQAGRFSNLDIQPGSGTPGRVIVHGAVAVDLGGIAKGFAVDRALNALRTAGCESGLVNCGGDLAVFGPEPQRIACVDDAGNGAWVNLQNAAIASSNAQQDGRPAEHQGYYDGRDRASITAGRVTIKAPSAAVADALTKCLLVDFGTATEDLLREFDAQAMLLVPPDSVGSLPFENDERCAASPNHGVHHR